MRLTILTDGEYPQCEACVGRVVDGTEFKSIEGVLKGYDVTVRELRRVGAEFDSTWGDDDEMYFSIHSNHLTDRPPEIEVTQDEYR